MPRGSRPRSQREISSLSNEGRSGARRLLRTGVTMLGVSSILWMATVYAVTSGPDMPSPAAQVFAMTLTILLWPAATLGLVALVCWLIIKIVETTRPPNGWQDDRSDER